MTITENFSTNILLLLTGLSALVVCSINFLQRRRLYYYASKFDGPPSLPLIGSAFYLFGGNNRIIRNITFLVGKYKSPWKIWLGRGLYIVLTEPEDVKIVLNQALEKAQVYEFTKPILNEGLFTGPVEKWKRHRKVISKTFSMPILNGFVEVFSEHAVVLLKRLDGFVGDGYFDVFPVIMQKALEITCETVIGTRGDDQPSTIKLIQNFGKAMELVNWRILQYWVHFNFIWQLTPYSRQLDKLSKRINNFVDQTVTLKKTEYRREKQLEENEYRKDFRWKKSFLDNLIQLSEEGKNLPDDELMEEAQTIIAAGSESIGSTVSYTLIMLGMHPSIQDKVYQEIYGIYGNSNRGVTSEDLPQMEYLDQVIKETLRLFPVTALIARNVDRDIVTKSYTIPEGCQCLIPIMYIHKNSEIWKDPMSFRPERFTREEEAKRHPYSYLPFSRGPRNCIGFKYAAMAVKTILTMIVKSYKIETSFRSVSDLTFKAGVLLKAEKGFMISLERRLK